MVYKSQALQKCPFLLTVGKFIRGKVGYSQEMLKVNKDEQKGACAEDPEEVCCFLGNACEIKPNPSMFM